MLPANAPTRVDQTSPAQRLEPPVKTKRVLTLLDKMRAATGADLKRADGLT